MFQTIYLVTDQIALGDVGNKRIEKQGILSLFVITDIRIGCYLL